MTNRRVNIVFKKPLIRFPLFIPDIGETIRENLQKSPVLVNPVVLFQPAVEKK
jgi:hypothetical protein